MIMRMKLGNNPLTYLPIYVSEKDRYKPTFIIGKTGSGKSELFLNIFQSDNYSNCARVFVDPIGAMSKKAWNITKGKALYCSIDHPIALNPMKLELKPHQIIDIIIESLNLAVKKTTANEMLTSKMIQILSDVITRCIGDGLLNLQHVREAIARDSKDAMTRDGIISRLDLLLKDPDFRQIICASETLDIGKLIEEKKTFILDCSGMSLMKKVFLGTILVKMLQSHYTYSRVKGYKPLILMLDEAHYFLDQNFALIIKEGRNFQFSTILCTQDFAWIDPKITHTLLSNSGTIVAMKTGFIESSRISSEFFQVKVDDFKGIEKYHAYVKTPDTECIVKLPRPIFVKELKLPTMKQEIRTFDLKWFDLPSYCFQLDYDQDGAVAGNGL